MRTYGLTDYRKQRGCCPGHDDFPSEAYGSKTSKKKFRLHTKVMRRRGRRIVKNELKIEAKLIN